MPMARSSHLAAHAGLGAVLSNARVAAGLTQEELADRSGLSVRAIRNLETGRTGAPRQQSVGLLAGALGMPPGQLLPRPCGSAPALSAAVPRASAVPPQSELPACYPSPVGRFALVTELCELLTDTAGGPATKLAVVTGPPGSGKTATVAHTARLLSRDFPDLQVYIDLDGQSGEPMTAAAVAERVLRSFGFASPSQSLEEATARARAALARHRAIVVLDNAVSEAQVRPLICATPRSAILVAACRTLPALPAREVQLDALDPVEAAKLLGIIAGPERTAAEPSEALSIAQSCGYLPLALHIAGLWLAARPHRRLRELAERLRDEAARLDLLRIGDLSLRASVGAAYRRLTEVQRIALGKLRTLHGFFEVTDAVPLLGISEQTTADLIDDLAHRQVVHAVHARDGRPPLYHLHESFRLYAASVPAGGSPRRPTRISRAW
jgi:transcriptional regulator with XRE-family HTH domain